MTRFLFLSGNWLYFDGFYYRSGSSSSTRRTKRWLEAESVCDDYGAHLTSIQNDKENEFVSKREPSHNQWIGLSGKKTHYAWSDNSDASYQPDGFDTQPLPDLQAQDCALLQADDSSWQKTNCLEEASFVCKSPGKLKNMDPNFIAA